MGLVQNAPSLKTGVVGTCHNVHLFVWWLYRFATPFSNDLLSCLLVLREHMSNFLRR